MSDRYLKDRRTGELYGWNHEMSKLHYMKEVQRDEDGWDDGKPDPTYVDPNASPPADPVFPVATNPADLEADRQKTESEALARASEQGQKDLNDPAPYDEEGHAFLGYDEDGDPVYETDEERDERVTAEAGPLPPPGSEPDEPKPVTRRKR